MLVIDVKQHFMVLATIFSEFSNIFFLVLLIVIEGSNLYCFVKSINFISDNKSGELNNLKHGLLNRNLVNMHVASNQVCRQLQRYLNLNFSTSLWLNIFGKADFSRRFSGGEGVLQYSETT